MIRKFVRDAKNYRYDTKWYGIGRSDTVFKNNAGSPGVKWFLNSYKFAPVYISTINRVGIITDIKSRPWKKGLFELYYTGSRNMSRHSWAIRIHKFFIGGETPKWIIRFQDKLAYRRALKEAMKSGEGLCPVCKHGVLYPCRGYPGEHLIVCKNCKVVTESSFDIGEVI